MSISFEDFSTAPPIPKPDEEELSRAEVEAEKAASYESGYAAGWEDANKSSAEAQSQLGAEFSRHLQEISFTFFEARAHILEAVHPVLEEMVATMLPELVRVTMGQRILETVEPVLEQAADQPVLITVCPGAKEQVEALLNSALPTSVRIEEEPTLTDGQAFLRIGQVERKVDLTEAIAKVAAALGALGELNNEVLKHG